MMAGTVEADLAARFETVLRQAFPGFRGAFHEGLTAADQRWTCWRNGKLAAFRDEVVQNLQEGDFKG